MRRLISIPPILFQIVITFLILYLVFMWFFISKGNEKAGIIEGLGFKNSRTAYAMITIAFTMVICFVIGLPIRIIPGVYQWWTHKPIINGLMFLTGLSLIILYSNSFFTNETISAASGVSETYTVGDPYFILTGWFLIAFSLLHLYPVTFSQLTHRK